MKHLAKIQSEFLKESSNWDKLSLEEQKGYLQRHPGSKRRLTAGPASSEETLDTKQKNTTSDVSAEQISQLSSGIKNDLEKLYHKMNLVGRFNSDAFTIKKNENSILVNIPYLSTSRNEAFLDKMDDESKKIILKHLKKLGINKKKSDFKYEKKADGFLSASTYSLKLDESTKKEKKISDKQVKEMETSLGGLYQVVGADGHSDVNTSTLDDYSYTQVLLRVFKSNSELQGPFERWVKKQSWYDESMKIQAFNNEKGWANFRIEYNFTK